MSDRVHTAMDPVQAPGLEAPRDAGAANPSRSQLLDGHNAVLARRQLSYQRIGSGEFLPHMVNNPPASAGAPY
jgi:hypothetical protein